LSAGGVSLADAPQLAIIDYGMGNLRSVQRAWEHVGARARIVHSPDAVGQVDALVFPGQGAMPDCMRLLAANGFDRFIRDWIAADRPFFGICLGLQALFEHSEESDTAGLGIFPGVVRRFRLPAEFKIPHMGWNAVEFAQDAPLTDGLVSGVDQMYFVHSYRVETDVTGLPWMWSDYGERFVAAVRKGNCFACQFHPEKSQSKGLQIYRNFLLYLARIKGLSSPALTDAPQPATL
jgi:imidazole glycerol-phosphate synthase subunit HisH